MKGKVPGIEEVIVLQYSHIDDTGSILPAAKMLDSTAENVALLDHVKAVFKAQGWEGDGELGIFWIPPFFFNQTISDEMTYGTWVWHVKQHNNGISFLGFTKEGLEYVRGAALLRDQNDAIFGEEK